MARQPQATLAPGARVVIRGEEWLVLLSAPAMNNTIAVRAVGISELVRNHEKTFLTPALDEVRELRPEETQLVSDDSPGFRRSRLYLDALLRRTPPTDADLHLGHRGVMVPKDYQLQPAHKALSNLRPRILLADGVGLGKTIEAGVLLSELIKRGRGNRILVVAIKSMLAQLQQELWARFAIGLVRLDSVGLQRVRAMIPANKNPFYYFHRAIISIDTLKNDGQYRHYLEQCKWDAIVIDEAHNVANTDTQRSRVASLLARTCDSLILTSATPHNGKRESFANLINMLDPTAVADPAHYRAEDIEGLFVRRFKKDLDDQAQRAFSTRKSMPIHIPANQAEEQVFETLADLSFSTIAAKRRNGRDALFQTTLLKGFLSSPAACLSTVDHRLGRIEKSLDQGKGDARALRDDRGKLRSFRRDVERVDDRNFSKYQMLLKELKRLKWTGSPDSPRVIIFSERRDTLAWLEERLTKAFKPKKGVLRLFHAGMPDQDQMAAVDDFGKRDAPVRLLLASDVASEGVNLHFFCHNLIHFDIPWSLIRLEQRNGRIDRFGQKEQPVVRYLLTTSAEPSIRADLRIVDRLVEKAQVVEENLGDAARAMGLYDADKEEDATATAIEEGLEPGLFLPDDEPEIDFLSLLDDAQNNQPAEKVPTRDSVSLYDGDLAFVRAAFEELIALNPELNAPEWYDHPSVSFRAPEDLQRRCHQLPREAVPPNWEFFLSTDRQRVAASIEAARKKEGAWPDTHLLWELHPVMQWLVDKVLVRFGRHEAPVVVAPGLSASGANGKQRANGPKGNGKAKAGQSWTSAMVFQGVLSNRRSQPVIVEWFAVVFDSGLGGSVHVESLPELLQRSGLMNGLSNPGKPSRHQAELQGAVDLAVEAARGHMEVLRLSRGKELGSRLRRDARRLRRWHDNATAVLDRHVDEAKAKGRRKLPRNVAEKFEHRLRTLDGWYEHHDRWLKDTFHAEQTPYLRLALVLTGE